MSKRQTTDIEWTAALLPSGISQRDREWIESLGCVVQPDATRPGRWLVAGYTFNPWRGCTKWAGGCLDCA